MTMIHIESVEAPFDQSLEGATHAVLLLSRGEVMGFFEPPHPVHALAPDTVRSALTGLAARGVGRQLLLDPTDLGLVHAVDTALQLTEDSPMPEGEWPGVTSVLEEALTLSLLDIAPASLRRYSNGTRTTPDDVAARLHVVALLIADLVGSYNEFGIRRWFTRPRTQLDGRSPANILSGAWNADDPEVARVRALASSLLGGGFA